MKGGKEALLAARRIGAGRSVAENGPEADVRNIVKSMGLVFGDIGTSPIYTLAVIFLTTPATEQNILGVLSLIIWTLILIITGQYAWLAMSLGKKGEGGTIVLRELLLPLLRKGRTASFVTLITILGISLLMGDGVITPAISILSAVEGLELIPGLEGLAQSTLILIAAVIAILLFSFQRRGTERVAFAFGPIMVVWFAVLTLTGLVSLIQAPFMVGAFNPLAGIAFLGSHGIAGFFILSSVILCATGGEALYADMGHLGRAPIRRAWAFVFVALVINYLGQGAFLLQHQQPSNLLFEMFYAQAPLVYIPLLVLSIAATVIASQAMISGIFSIVYQGITTRILPILKIDYTSSELRSQIYIDIVNWLLLVAVLIVMVVFKASSNLAAAYGLAVTGDMALTGTLITSILFLRGHRGKALIAAGITMIDITFLLASLTKLPAGAYWSLLIAAVPFTIIVIYHFGQKRIYRHLQPIPFQRFLNEFREVYATKPKIEGTALFFARDFQQVPPYVGLTVFENNIIYEDNVLVSIRTLDRPFGISWEFRKSPAPGIRLFEVRSGYLEMIDVVAIFREAGLEEKTIFYGLDEIVSTNIIWKIFALIKRLSPSFVQFYKLPANRIHGVITRVEALGPSAASPAGRTPLPVRTAGRGAAGPLVPREQDRHGHRARPGDHHVDRKNPQDAAAPVREGRHHEGHAGAVDREHAEPVRPRPGRCRRGHGGRRDRGEDDQTPEPDGAVPCADLSLVLEPEQVLPEPLHMHRLRLERPQSCRQGPAVRSSARPRPAGAGASPWHAAAASAASRSRARARSGAWIRDTIRRGPRRPRLRSRGR